MDTFWHYICAGTNIPRMDMKFVLGEFICFIVFKTSPDPFVFTGTYEIDPKDLEIGAEIGRGQFGVSRPTVSS